MIDAVQVVDLQLGFELHGITSPEEQRELVRQATGGEVRALTHAEAARLIEALREMPRIANTTPAQRFIPPIVVCHCDCEDDDGEL